MNRFLLGSLIVWIAGACAVPDAGGQRRPNFILFIADDMAWDDCGAYGNPHIRTPNIDRLAKEGMRFDRAYLTISSCSPSRSSLITGRYPHNTGAEELHWPLPADQVTFVELLKNAGYWTASAGKWHLGDAARSRFDLVKEADTRGFQLPTGKEATTAKMVAKGIDKSGCAEWVATLRDRPRGQPFFLWLAALDPHRAYEENTLPSPHRPEDVVVPPYLPDVPATRKDLALYYDEIARLDGFIGKVLEELDRQGERENTFVLFISDNGRPFPRCKITVYDAGIKTPFIVRWSGRVKPGSTCSSLVSTIDIAPTVLRLAGLRVPSSFQGKSFVLLLDVPDAKIRSYAFAEANWHDFDDHARAVTDGRFKYIRNHYEDIPRTPGADAIRSPTFQAMRRLRDAGKLTPAQMACFVKPRPAEELYYTAADPHELKNLAGDPRFTAELKRMREALAFWEKGTGDFVPARRSPDEFDRETGKPNPNRVRPRIPRKKRPADR